MERGVRADQGRSAPSADELFAAVVELASTRSSTFKGTARRYSLCAADAEDAYQRGLDRADH